MSRKGRAVIVEEPVIESNGERGSLTGDGDADMAWTCRNPRYRGRYTMIVKML